MQTICVRVENERVDLLVRVATYRLGSASHCLDGGLRVRPAAGQFGAARLLVAVAVNRVESNRIGLDQTALLQRLVRLNTVRMYGLRWSRCLEIVLHVAWHAGAFLLTVYERSWRVLSGIQIDAVVQVLVRML